MGVKSPRLKQDARRYPAGAECQSDGVSFRVWAPSRRRIAIVLENGDEHQLSVEPDGYFSTVVHGAAAGSRYWFRLDGNDKLYSDPASRLQPEGPHGPSEVVDPHSYGWQDAEWRGHEMTGQVIYELHVGTFTPEGTWQAAIEKLPFLASVGITLIEMMPVNEFPGRFGWGYDGAGLFAPTRPYGSPDDLRAFVDTAHGIGVILDVVYNHLGPDGNVLPSFSVDYFTGRYDNEWGEAINFDGSNAHGVRDFFMANAAYWVDEFHLDGLRLDATQSMVDSSPDHIIAAIVRSAREAAGDRRIILIGENEPQHTRLVRSPEAGGYGLDALWNDDLHHSAMVALTGHNEAYYEDYLGSPQEFVSAAKYGYLFQGQRYAHQGQPRGTPGLDLPPQAFVSFIQNHDQVANSARGLRFHQLTSPGRARAMTAFFLLMPGTPMLFQGQEFWASSPFLYFCDHNAELARQVREGRHDFVAQFRASKPKCSRTWTILVHPMCSIAASWLGQRRIAMSRSWRCTGTFCASDETIQRLPGSGEAVWTAPFWRERRSCCASSGLEAQTGCCSSISELTWHGRASRSHSWRRPKTIAGRSAGPASRRRTADAERHRSRPIRAGGFPDMPRCCWRHQRELAAATSRLFQAFFFQRATRRRR